MENYSSFAVFVFTLETGEVDDSLDEDGVVSYVRVFGVQLGERAEEGAAAGDVHVADGPLEGRGGDVGPEGVDDVLPVVLVQQHQGHLVGHIHCTDTTEFVLIF